MFQRHVLGAAVAAACSAGLLVQAGNALAQSANQSAAVPTQLPPVIITASPLASDLFELAPPASFLDGPGLVLRRRSTLGETLSGMPGVASSQFGPNASRPVIRGLDGDRIRVLQNGAGMLDASSVSPDHAVAVDPLVIDRVEVVRGPAALLYGGTAVGGVVNVIDNRIPVSAVEGVTGAGELRFGGADRERGGALKLEGGNGRFALHADVHTRQTSDLRIPGLMRSERLRASGSGFGLPASGVEPDGKLTNSASRANGGALGASLTWDRGYAGISYGNFKSDYGTVGEETVRIDMESSRIDLGAEVRDLPGIANAIKFKLARTDYEHKEVEDGVVGTTFRNKGYDARFELLHAKIGPMRGALGVQLTRFDFSALGAEAFVPQTNTDAKGLFIYEELPVGPVKLSMGARHDRTLVRSDGGGSIDVSTGNPRFDPAQQKTFSTNSGALGAVYQFAPGMAIAANISLTQRAPTYYELFANGPHLATLGYEVGNANFGKEKSRAIDLALRVRSGAHSGSVGIFRQRFDNFIAAFSSGNTRGADGEINPVDGDNDGVADGSGEEIFNELVFRAVPAVFRGLEAQGRFRLIDAGDKLDLEVWADYVRAHNDTSGEPLPRIAPLRFGAALEWQGSRIGSRFDVTRVAGQNRVSATSGELPTDAYTMANLTLTYRLISKKDGPYVFLKGTNLLNAEARNHVSFLKEIAPLGGRALQLGLRGSF